ncbi:hypothetical protein DMB92_00800 [Campylobacter sp. MIT 99-7217]|uniref:methyl-accepting chemotaxis protein n=1 Tax=Campylobacter sp. MIT 99-7217 TaxID=535091 RepID=UPI0011599609|nr:methyl-accepting chemotaxis protein [Campylobacter sp. MIT 99-7217]TQR34535.1 hypothetical protein DMB92_00800 [Campylobacter sp. MIT 99-7217]
MKIVFYLLFAFYICVLILAIIFQNYLTLSFICIAFGFNAILAYLYLSDSKIIKKLLALSQNLKDGEFNERIIYFRAYNPHLKGICDNINNAIDHLEAYLREINTSISCSSHNEFYRKALSQGLKGIFSQNINFINTSLKNIEETSKSHFPNALSKALLDLSLNNQNKDLSKISNTLNAEIISMDNISHIIDLNSTTSEQSRQSIQILSQNINTLSEMSNSNKSRVENFVQNSKSITSIIDIINDIAKQTDLLALNAAIEAARAGVHGKGFSVVAEEIKKLAERTQKSTNEISMTIKTMQQDFSEIKHNTEEVFEITSKSQEQLTDFNESFENIETNNKNLLQEFSIFAQNLMLCTTRINHILYKSHLYLNLNSGQDFEEEDSFAILNDNTKIKNLIITLISKEHFNQCKKLLENCAQESSKLAKETIDQNSYNKIIENIKILEQQSGEILSKLKL